MKLYKAIKNLGGGQKSPRELVFWAATKGEAECWQEEGIDTDDPAEELIDSSTQEIDVDSQRAKYVILSILNKDGLPGTVARVWPSNKPEQLIAIS